MAEILTPKSPRWDVFTETLYLALFPDGDDNTAKQDGRRIRLDVPYGGVAQAGDCTSCGKARSAPHACRTTTSRQQQSPTTSRTTKATGMHSFPRHSNLSASSVTTTSNVERKSLAINAVAISTVVHTERGRFTSTKTKGGLSKYRGVFDLFRVCVNHTAADRSQRD